MKIFQVITCCTFLIVKLFLANTALSEEKEHGLVQKIYQGNWNTLPNFNELNHSEEQIVTNFELGELSQRSLNYFGLTFEGFLEIEFDGEYTFKLTSDDGSRLLIDEETIIDNDGLHGAISRTGTVSLDKGFHHIKLEYFEKTRGQFLDLQYQFEGTSMKTIPSSNLYIALPKDWTHGLSKGILSKYFEGQTWSQLPDFKSFSSKSSEVLENFGLGSFSNRSIDNFGLVQTGLLYIEEESEYTFKLSSDDGSRLYLNNELLVDNDGLHGIRSRVSEKILLPEGLHQLRLEYFERSGGQALGIEFRKGQENYQSIPGEQLFHDPDAEPEPPADAPEPIEKLSLPIEVIGNEGKIVTRTLTLSSTIAEHAESLWLQVNNLGYQDKASVQINGGPWVLLNHETVQIEKQEAARGGMVHGGFNTIRFTLPIAESLATGQNEIRFRFNFSDGISIGYRVIALNLLDSSGAKLLNPAFFKNEDPREWEPPHPDATSLKEGEQLWKYGSLVSNYLKEAGKWYAYSIPPSEPIKARCADCHTHDGRDLEIFSYSNQSIIERSKFHGLSHYEGELIASYIRSLSEKHDNVGRYGRPWNPPYQPGPEIAKLPTEQWAAGAGLQAVLDEDQDMLQGMFGKTKNISQADVNQYFDSDKMWDTSLQPLAIQLPDWKHWLPLVHPKDAFGRSNYYQNADKKYDPEKAYKEIRDYLSITENHTEKSLFHQLHQFWLNFRLFLAQGSSNQNHWRTTDGDPFTKGLKTGVSKEMAATSLARLLAVKFFELHQEFKLENIAEQLIDRAEQPRARQWLGRQYNVFEIPPHFTACFKSGRARCHNYEGQARETGNYESTAWYQLQQVINPGIASSRDVVPVDYNYQPTLILRASETSGIMEPVRFYFSSNVMYQTRTRAAYFTPNDKEGFNMRVMGPWLFFGSDNRNNFEGLPPGEMPRLLNDIQTNLGTMFINAQLAQFLKEMKKPRNSLDIWKRRSSSKSGEHKHLDPVNLTDQDMPSLNQAFSGQLRHYAHKIYWVIPQFIRFGARCDLINGVKDWSESAWPKISWDQFNCP